MSMSDRVAALLEKEKARLAAGPKEPKVLKPGKKDTTDKGKKQKTTGPKPPASVKNQEDFKKPSGKPPKKKDAKPPKRNPATSGSPKTPQLMRHNKGFEDKTAKQAPKPCKPKQAGFISKLRRQAQGVQVQAALPKWPGADKVYSRMYRLLEKMGAELWKAEVARAKKARRKPKPGVMSTPEMDEIIDALNKGDEEKLKGLMHKHQAYRA